MLQQALRRADEHVHWLRQLLCLHIPRSACTASACCVSKFLTAAKTPLTLLGMLACYRQFGGWRAVLSTYLMLASIAGF